MCTETRTDKASAFVAIRSPGSSSRRSRAGTPAQVHAWQYVDDVAILDAAAAPSYAETRPNGPECEPVCRQASASWTMQ